MGRYLILFMVSLLAAAGNADAAKPHAAPAVQTAKTECSEALHFNAAGEFTVMQLTDLHYNGTERQSGHVPVMLARLIREAKPDLIVITGDLIYARPAEEMLREICDAIAVQGIPYAITLGNHDAEQGLTHAQLYAIIRTLPGCVNRRYNPADERQGDFVIPILSADGKGEAARLYVMDSNDYNEDNSYKGFMQEQVAWYRTQCTEAAVRNGGKVNSLIFFHIPLTEFTEAYATAPVAGFRLERECPPRDNSGMFRALVDGGEVSGIFAGHDHSNNYVAQKEGIALCYGRYSGSFAEYQELVSGARLIRLEAGKRGFTTWELLANGREDRKVTIPQP